MKRYLRLTLIGTLILVPIIWIIYSSVFRDWSSTLNKSLFLFSIVLLSVVSFLAGLKDYLDVISVAREPKASRVEKIRSLTATKQATDTISLEYRVAVLEGIISLMLENKSTKISPLEVENIRKDALNLLRHSYPDAEISVDNRWQND